MPTLEKAEDKEKMWMKGWGKEKEQLSISYFVF
jgi:hypothetical protein